MKNVIFLMLLAFQFAVAVEKDSLHANTIFKKYYFALEEEEEDDCDACGCSASGGSMGFASMLNSNFVGIRYFYQSYKSTDGFYSNSPWYNENYNTAQIWARVPVYNNIQISVLAPYQFHNRDAETGNQSISGIGDIALVAMYRLYQTHKDSTVFIHTLNAGLGIKMPTGKYSEANSGGANPSFQVGTGSWDYPFVAEYIIKRKKIGLNALVNYIVKTENKQYYRFGNQFNYAGIFYYLYEKNGYALAPQIGFAGEVYNSNYLHNQKVSDTSGDVLFGKLGFEIGKDKFSFGTSAMLPIQQNLNGGKVEANYRFSVNLNYSL